MHAWGPIAGIGSFLVELKRRRVFRVGAVYGAARWLIIQVVATVQPYLNLPAWAVTLVIVLVALGLPAALMLGWAFGLTPEGLLRANADAAPTRVAPAGRRWIGGRAILILVALCLAAGVRERGRPPDAGPRVRRSAALGGGRARCQPGHRLSIEL